MKRRHFIKKTAQGSAALTLGATLLSCVESTNKSIMTNKTAPIAICTWGFTEANRTAGKALENGLTALDAAIKGVAVEEENVKNTTVGKGGAPDREGSVTLDACVMDSNGDCGAVVCVENITNVAALAKVVMEETPHVMLAGKGAEELAYKNGFQAEQLLTDSSEAAYREWLKTSEYKPIINIENHDTIGMLCMDQHGDIAGACTTSGLSYKMKGRVGDSPIIGSGLFVDNEIGGAAATGMGEEIMKTVGSFLIVELMRQGKTPQEACEEAVKRIITKNKNIENFQVAYIALNKKGETGSYCIHPGFAMMKYKDGVNERIASTAALDS
ncbi:glycosylasparaginase [Nonlabens arenilitoris]|uniref:Glycosylasparaginase n=1 Tax=Nonlabens arenilitoris TaxID=1217969 RepID=A0A2S7U904_9FLAO|nr:N(4)-(beta-N-acetylglucosaminyl)-L-asparaginase [Nonlabens arenilitoris]PQJ31041.1 glycosylasparaginase [Nonlabens arenilitoris]